MPGVRDAAVALIGVAPESTVLTVLRMLVDAVTPASVQALQAPASAVPRPVPFPGSSPEHRGNGHADGPYSHASAA